MIAVRPTGAQTLRPYGHAFRLLHVWFGSVARVLQPGGSFYIWGGYANCGNYPPVLKALNAENAGMGAFTKSASDWRESESSRPESGRRVQSH